ncbi:MAG: hypothetical protein EBU85_03320 [Actinobacteria bacterium]|nr:hypothetical protein [Actinomycetota bacterium]
MTQTVLFVCTANICRSPYAARALRHALGADSGFEVFSAGVRSEWLELVGEPACPEMPAVGSDDAPHAATQLTAELVRDADLIVAFEAAHRAAIVDLIPRAQIKTYTARQVERLARAVAAPTWPPAAPAPSEDPLKDLNGARSWAPFAEDHDVTDPHGDGIEAHQACAAEIDAVITALAQVLQR